MCVSVGGVDVCDFMCRLVMLRSLCAGRWC